MTNGEVNSFLFETYSIYILSWLFSILTLVLVFFQKKYKKRFNISLIIECIILALNQQYIFILISLLAYLLTFNHLLIKYPVKVPNKLIGPLRRLQQYHKCLPTFTYLIISLLATIAIFYQENTYVYSTPWTKPVAYLNWLAIICLYWILRATFNNFWFASITSITVYDLFFIADLVKIKIRNDAIVPSDLILLKGTNGLIGMIDWRLTLGGILIILFTTALIIFLNKFYKVTKWQQRYRLIYAIVSLLFLSSTAFWNHENTPVYNFMTFIDNERLFHNQALGAKRNGPLLQFLNNVDVQIMKKPNNYNQATMQKLAQKYQINAKQINKNRRQNINNYTVIFNLSESFANPKRVPSVSYKGNAIPTINHIKAMTNSGLMMSSGYGGGTANMEYMSLTGLATCNFSQTLNIPYTQIVPFHKHTYSFADNFKHANAIHPYSNFFYDRSTDYPKMGFQTFRYLDSPDYPIKHEKWIQNNPYLSDQTAYENAEDQINHLKSGQFINLVTMQNHYPYDDLYTDSAKWHGQADYGTDINELDNYIEDINNTDKAVKPFIKTLDQSKKPIVWVFYGDHLPGLYNNPMSTDGLILHETDYFIYLNPVAKKKAHLTHIKHQIVDPTEFIPLTLQITNSKVTPFNALLTDVSKYIPAKCVNTSTNSTFEYNQSGQFINKSGHPVSPKYFTKHQKQLWHDYLLVQYDQTAGHHYLTNNFFKNQK